MTVQLANRGIFLRVKYPAFFGQEFNENRFRIGPARRGGKCQRGRPAGPPHVLPSLVFVHGFSCGTWHPDSCGRENPGNCMKSNYLWRKNLSEFFEQGVSKSLVGVEGLLVPPFSPSGFLRKPLRQSISLPFAQQHYSYAEKDRMGRPTGRNPGRKTWYSGHCSREKSGYTETRDDRGELRGSNLPLLRGRSCPEPEP